MNLNYLAFFLIAFVPLIIAYIWYHPNFFVSKWSEETYVHPNELGLVKWVFLFIMSFALVYGYINLIIHQMGFYELFFTDIMKGSKEAELVVQEFMDKYGEKHRHAGHGFFHGLINAFVFALPLVSITAMLEGRGKKYIILHFSYWLITSAIIGTLISAFV